MQYGVLARTTAASGKRQIYELTESGRGLFTVIVALRQWGEVQAFGPGEQHSVLLDNRGIPVPELRPKSAAGRELELASTRVEKLETDTPDHNE